MFARRLTGFAWVLLMALAACMATPGTAAAHLLPPQNATIHAVGNRARHSRSVDALTRIFPRPLVHVHAIRGLGRRAHSDRLRSSLAGFNVGVELGQFIFLAAVLALASLCHRFLRTTAAPLWPRLPSATAAVLGAIMPVQRLG
jgi:hypothetical protein